MSAGGIVLLLAAVKSRNTKTCKGIAIEINGVSNNFFIDKADVLDIIKNFVGADPQGRVISSFNLGEIENSLKKDVWIKNAELFFDNNEVLSVLIDEREPVARIFSITGKSFYIDSSIKVLPLSEKFSARLPVFTGYPNSPDFLSKADSNLLAEVRNLSLILQADSFLMAMIEQVDITSQRKFEMLPKIGNQLIVFGKAEDAAKKFEKLRLFYKAVITRVGWSKYSVINLEYKNQVVAKIKDAADKTSDSLRALQIMQLIAERSARLAADSIQTFLPDNNERATTDSSMILQSVQRDETETSQEFIPAELLVAPGVATTRSATKPAIAKPAAAKPLSAKPIVPKFLNKPKPINKPEFKKPIVKKPAIIKPVTANKPAPVKPPAQKPKAVMGQQ